MRMNSARMRTMKNRRPALDKERTLKIDKDCFVEEEWIRDYFRMVIVTC
jgi:hypothetical protein